MRVVRENINALDFQYYIEAILNQYEYQNNFREDIYGDSINSDDYVDERPLFDPKKYSELYPGIDTHHESALEAIKKLSNDKLINIINTLILENYELEIIEDERPNRHGTDNARISDSEV